MQRSARPNGDAARAACPALGTSQTGSGGGRTRKRADGPGQRVNALFESTKTRETESAAAGADVDDKKQQIHILHICLYSSCSGTGLAK